MQLSLLSFNESQVMLRQLLKQLQSLTDKILSNYITNQYLLKFYYVKSI